MNNLSIVFDKYIKNLHRSPLKLYVGLLRAQELDPTVVSMVFQSSGFKHNTLRNSNKLLK